MDRYAIDGDDYVTYLDACTSDLRLWPAYQVQLVPLSGAFQRPQGAKVKSLAWIGNTLT